MFRKRLANWFLRRAQSKENSEPGKRAEDQDWHPFFFFLMLFPCKDYCGAFGILGQRDLPKPNTCFCALSCSPAIARLCLPIRSKRTGRLVLRSQELNLRAGGWDLRQR